MGLRLGAFRVGEEIGRGGMARVFAGSHHALGTDVAIKVMSSPALESEEGRSRRFAKEIEAVARLQHPGVVMVFDHGIVDAHAASLHPNLQPGLPWFAMEYCGGGSLADYRFESWPDLHSAIVTALDALAYTHACGVLHRDLKPANVLIADPNDVRPGIKLADFGLALGDQDEVTAVRSSLGTPHFMAPEQVQGRWRDFDGSTDLYAFGCMAWRLTTGRPPFLRGEGTLTQILTSQLRDPPPRFFPLFPVPIAFEGWLRRILQKDPQRRFLMVADALAALPREDAPLSAFDSTRATDEQGEPQHTVALADDLTLVDQQLDEDTGLVTWDEDALAEDDLEAIEAGTVETGAAIPPATIAPMPDNWRRDRTMAPEERLLGAGLALFGLRPTPMVGRQTHQEHLWNCLQNVQQSSRMQAILLQGEAGCGKSRLSSWLCRQAGWLGAARALMATHSDGQAPGQGLSGMVDFHLRCHGLEGADLHARLSNLCTRWGIEGDVEARALSQIIRPSRAEGALQFNSPQERYAVIRRLLRRMAKERPLILLIDDIQWGSDALFFVEDLLLGNREADLPILVLITARTQALKERPFIEERLVRLVSGGSLQPTDLSPLTDEDTRQLVTELVGLDNRLVTQVATRSEGNPLFAVQLVGDWVARGVLEASETGFQLAQGEIGKVPDDVHQLWLRRLAELEVEAGDGSSVALELAAVLGREVAETEWRQLCRQRETHLPESLTDRLFKAGLALPTDSGWSFCHALFQESLERRALEGSRWTGHHEAAAQVLEACLGPKAPGRSRRLGTHLLEAKAYSGAITHLWQAADDHFTAAEVVAFEEILDQIDPALIALGLPADHGWYFDQARRRFQLATRRLQSEDQLETMARLVQWAKVLNDDERMSRIANIGAQVLEHAGDLEKPLVLLGEALNREGSTPQMRARILARLARLHLRRGEVEQAEAAATRAMEIYTEQGELGERSDMLQTLGDIRRNQGRLQEAVELLNEAIPLANAQGRIRSQAFQINSLGEVFRADGRLDDALKAYEQARSLGLQLEDTFITAITACNMSLILLAMERIREAAPFLEEADAIFRRSGKHYFALITQAGLLACSALDDDPDLVRSAFEDIQDGIGRTGAVEMDLALCLQATGRLMARRESYDLAVLILSAALQQWDRLGLKEHRDRCRQDLESAGATVER